MMLPARLMHVSRTCTGKYTSTHLDSGWAPSTPLFYICQLSSSCKGERKTGRTKQTDKMFSVASVCMRKKQSQWCMVQQCPQHCPTCVLHAYITLHTSLYTQAVVHKRTLTQHATPPTCYVHAHVHTPMFTYVTSNCECQFLLGHHIYWCTVFLYMQISHCTAFKWM